MKRNKQEKCLNALWAGFLKRLTKRLSSADAQRRTPTRPDIANRRIFLNASEKKTVFLVQWATFTNKITLSFGDQKDLNLACLLNGI